MQKVIFEMFTCHLVYHTCVPVLLKVLGWKYKMQMLKCKCNSQHNFVLIISYFTLKLWFVSFLEAI